MDNIGELVNKIYIQRHKLKMIWFMINRKIKKADEVRAENGENEETKEDEDDDGQMTEEKQAKLQEIEENKQKWRQIARARTENLEMYIERLTSDKKVQEALMKPIKATKDHAVTSTSANFFHFIVFDMPRDLTRSLIEKSTRKGGHKKIAEIVQREKERDQSYYDSLKSYGIRKQRTHPAAM